MFHAHSIQNKMDAKSCLAAQQNKDACESYASCYHSFKKTQFDALRFKVRGDEIPNKAPYGMEEDRKAEWRGLKRIVHLVESCDRAAVCAEGELCLLL